MNYRESPPVPPWTSLVPRGLVGYEDRKRDEMTEAREDREEPDLTQNQEEMKRWVLITKLAVRFPTIGVPAIAEGVVPWDLEEFKRLVAEAQTRYLKELTNGR